ncbi:uncharacterized protein [Dermacentor albipictus]|uniref:uncharacterized protein isoform X2 n=1 Tax=Dermacentor albipictus TaxID=60249 RepID=UPI0038FD18D6
MTDTDPGPALRTQAHAEHPRGGYKTLFGPVPPEFVCWAAILATALGLTVWALRHALHRETDEPPPLPSTPGFCCEKLVVEMYRRANRTVDACNNFLDHACYHRDGLAEANAELYHAEVVHPTLQGILQMPASDVLRVYYISCLKVFSKGTSNTEGAVNAVADMFSSWDGGAELRVVDIAGILEIKFGVSLAFTLLLDLKADGCACVAELHRGSEIAGDFWNAEDEETRASVERSLLTLGERFGVKLTRRDIVEFQLLLSQANQKHDETEPLTGGFDVLGQLFPRASLDKWRLHVDDVCSCRCSDNMAVTVNDASAIRTLFDILESPRFHAHSATHLIVGTAVALFEREFLLDSVPGRGTALWTDFCDSSSGGLFELWELVFQQQLTNKEKDNALRSLYDSISGAVIADATDIFASPEDAKEASALISRLRLLLPTQASHWYQIFLPNLTEDYCANVIAIGAFRRKIALHDFDHVVRWMWLSHTVDDMQANRRGDLIAVSPAVYANMRFEALQETYVNAALVGVQIASILWQALFRHRGWSDAVSQQLDRHAHCLGDHVEHEDPTYVQYPLLSLRSTLRAVAGAGWHRPVKMWGFWKLSPSQLFYMLFYRQYVCINSVHDKLYEERARSTHLMRRVLDFCKAFQCHPLPIDAAAGCMHDRPISILPA